MNSYHSEIHLRSHGFTDIIDITGEVVRAVAEAGINEGMINIFVPGSTGSVTTMEYEYGVIEDLRSAIERLIPSKMHYSHDRSWGDGNGFSHVRAALMKPGLCIPVVAGMPTLGTWQQIVFIDFDNKPRNRKIIVQILGE